MILVANISRWYQLQHSNNDICIDGCKQFEFVVLKFTSGLGIQEDSMFVEDKSKNT